MIFLWGFAAAVLLSEARGALDKHPIQPSAYLTLGVGIVCLLAAIIGWLIGEARDD